MTISSEIPWVQKPILPLRVAADLLCISRSSLYRLRADGKVTFTRVGGKSVVRTASIVAYLEEIGGLPSDGAPRPGQQATQ